MESESKLLPEKVTGKGSYRFFEMLEPFTREQQEYVVLRLIGYGHVKAMGMVKEAENLSVMPINPRFQEIMETAKGKPEHWVGWAKKWWEDEIKELADVFVKEAIEQGLGELRKVEKTNQSMGMIRIAAEVANTARKAKGEVEETSSFDELVIKEHRELRMKHGTEIPAAEG